MRKLTNVKNARSWLPFFAAILPVSVAFVLCFLPPNCNYNRTMNNNESMSKPIATQEIIMIHLGKYYTALYKVIFDRMCLETIPAQPCKAGRLEFWYKSLQSTPEVS